MLKEKRQKYFREHEGNVFETKDLTRGIIIIRAALLQR